MPESEFPALKEMFNPTRFRRIARDVAEVYPGFDQRRFLKLTLPDLEPLSLLQRLRRVTEGLHATLPSDYNQALAILKNLAPQTESGFVSLFLPDYVSQYGLNHFDASMEALKFFTPIGSSEFGVRPFLKSDLRQTLRVMEKWSRDDDEHVRRLASEGCRPRLPWSFRLEALVTDPTSTARILENLKADPSLYVRKSVANHLNDITKDHPERVLDRLEGWNLEVPQTAWIARRALRSLIKSGNRRALAVIGAGKPAKLKLEKFFLSPKRPRLGDELTFSLRFTSLSKFPQKLVVDYTIHYVKKSGTASPKVFKWKELRLEAGETITLIKRQLLRNFTTRKHHPGSHRVEVKINGAALAEDRFVLFL